MDTEKREIRVLLLEDSLSDAELLRATFNSQAFRADLKRVQDESEFRRELQAWNPDIVISDAQLPTYSGKAALAEVREHSLHIPFIFFSGTIGEEAAIEALKSGATDYVLKQKSKRLVPAIRRALVENELKKRQAASEQMIKSQAQMLNLAREAIIVLDPKGKIVFWNHGAERMYGYSRAEAEQRDVTDVIYPSPALIFEEARQQTVALGYWEGQLEQKDKNNRGIMVSSHWTLVTSEDGRDNHILSINADITERIQLEKKFLRAQRLESIGTLASGIAHDLNNILAPILMASEILREEPLRPEAVDMLNTIQRSAERGADIVKQVLTFVRGTDGKHVSLRLGPLLKEISKVARETFPRNIEVRCITGRDLKPVQGDSTQLHQVLMNLCVNARDAMPNGGVLTLSAKNLSGADEKYLMVQVADTGTGVPTEIVEKMFEPFFTTKDPGKGTGLGLSTVSGIVKSHGGSIKVESKQGVGTTFQILLPSENAHRQFGVAATAGPVPKGQGECVLLIDDEIEIRKTKSQILVQNGYEVVTAEDGSSGIIQFAARKQDICLVITDLMMPGVDGSSLIDNIYALKPEVKLIVTSGTAERVHLPPSVQFLQKPVTPEDLIRTVYEVLHQEFELD